jgi:hypothetical protein
MNGTLSLLVKEFKDYELAQAILPQNVLKILFPSIG